MASEIDISNRALALLGQKPIASFADPNNVAEQCAQLYPAARDKCLEDRKWSFALSRDILAPLVITPKFGYANQFQVPSDCLILRSVDGPDQNGTLHWVREGDKILSDAGEIYITYSKSIENPDLYTNGFVEALTFKLASDLAMPITESKTMRDTYEQDYYRKISEAGSTDGGQGRQERLRSSRLVTARSSGVTLFNG